MRWISLPIQSSPAKGLFLSGVVVATSLAIYFSTQSSFWTFFSVVVLLVGVYDFVLPTTYQLSEDGVSSQILFYRRSKLWVSLRSYWVDKHGVLLSPFSQRSRFEAHRGLYLRFAGTDRQAVITFVKRKVNKQSVNESGV